MESGKLGVSGPGAAALPSGARIGLVTVGAMVPAVVVVVAGSGGGVSPDELATGAAGIAGTPLGGAAVAPAPSLACASADAAAPPSIVLKANARAANEIQSP